MNGPPRMAAIWCPDWPVTALRLAGGATDGTGPSAVMTSGAGGTVLACDQAAREQGVRRGMRRREAQARCPELEVLARNEAAEARAFEPLVLALESVAPGVEITRPGLAAIGTRGPTRYFGGEDGVLHALSRAVARAGMSGTGISETGMSGAGSGAGFGSGMSGVDVLIGAADGAFAAEQAARRGLSVPPGRSAAFLADLPVETLGAGGADGAELAALIDLLRRLGLRTLGAFAALTAADVLARFGPVGAGAHRRAGGRDDRPVAARRPPVEFTVRLDLEPPLDRVDAVAFSARGIAERFVTDLAAHGLACTCLELQADSDRGEQTQRRWRVAGVLNASDVLDRIRWQLQGWLAGPHPPSGPVSRLALVPVETVPTGTHQQALWGAAGTGTAPGDERAHRALARVQTLLGHGSVLTPVLDGGRSPAERTRLVPWGDERAPLRPPQQPWPGSLPAPAPTVLFDPPRPARVLDDAGRPVVVTERGAVPHPPARFALGDERPVAVTSWAGPWPVDERWWQPGAAGRTVRCQLVDVRGRAYLISTVGAHGWQVEAVYD